MAVEKGLVLAAIEEKFKGTSLTKNFKENLAGKWAEKIENDEGIEDYVSDREDIILEASAEADRRATDAIKKVKKPESTPAPEPEKKKEEPDNDMPAWARSLMEEITSLKSQQKRQTLAEKFKSDERVKKLNIPEKMLSRYIPADEDSFETAVQDFTSDFSQLAKSAKIAGFGGDTPADSTSGGDEAKKKAKKLSMDEARKIANVKI